MTHRRPEQPAEYDEVGLETTPLASLLPIADLTADCRAGRLEAAIGPESQTGMDPVCEAIARILYRRGRHAILTGMRGTGRTTQLRELARFAADGQIPFLRESRFLWIDCSNVGPEDSRACLEAILSAAIPGKDLVLCLDGIGSLLRRPGGGSNKPLFRTLARSPRLRIVGTMTGWEYADQIGSDADMLDMFQRVDLNEPNDDTVLAIARHHAARLEREFSIRLADGVVERAAMLSSTFILNEYQPAKTIRILRQACEDADYERTQLGQTHTTVTADDIVDVVSEITGIPHETVAGESRADDFEAALTSAVVGQDEAVKAAATELRLIKAGLTEPNKPASVLLFAGMTGVGKTELAKRIAELYSTSKRLNVYPIGNFTEPHSVSGIIGVPPGYVGHENGGRLINELNADPYSVILLDEAEKAHPNVWKPFLNLFDEGWIVDQRGVKAHADRAIFILTTNAGDQQIAQMSRSGKPEAEIAEHVKNTLARVRQERSSQPVFTPQFLARMKRILVFRPLDEPAMIGIARKHVGEMRRLWMRRREKEIDAPDEVIEHIGRRAFSLNEKSGGKEGGRIVRKLIIDLIETEIQQQSMRQPEKYKSCRRITLVLEKEDTQLIDSASIHARLQFVE